MDNKEIFILHAEFCKLMANPKRIEILFLIGKKEMCVEEIAAEMNLRIPNVSQHLAIMREKGIVDIRREGTKIYYKLANSKILQACTAVREVMIELMERKYNKIKNLIENKE